MIVQGGIQTAVASRSLRSAAAPVAQPAASMFMSRYGPALSLIGASTASAAHFSIPGAGGREPPGAAELHKIATDYDAAFAAARARDGTSDANARHVAQFETIMANRSSFPPGEFVLHTELDGGASLTTTVPAAGVSPLGIAAPPAGLVLGGLEGAGVSLSVASAAYAEWL